MDDDELVEQVKFGDENAAEELIRRYYTPVLRYCRRHFQSLEKSEDITQETFFRLFRGLDGYQGKKQFRAYLYTIARRLCIDESRKQILYPLENQEEIPDACGEIHQVEDQSEVEWLLGFLSPEQREAVILRFGGQLGFREIAAVTGCNLRTAQSRVRNALKIMRKKGAGK